jgi:hypothetical protein
MSPALNLRRRGLFRNGRKPRPADRGAERAVLRLLTNRHMPNTRKATLGVDTKGLQLSGQPVQATQGASGQ